jgi:hypothetical protein
MYIDKLMQSAQIRYRYRKAAAAEYDRDITTVNNANMCEGLNYQVSCRQ